MVVILGLANLVADGFSMGARATTSPDVRTPRKISQTAATFCATVSRRSSVLWAAGVRPLLAYLLDSAAQFPASIVLAAAALFAVGAARTFVTKRGFLRSGIEMLLVGSLAAVLAFGIGAIAASFA